MLRILKENEGRNAFSDDEEDAFNENGVDRHVQFKGEKDRDNNRESGLTSDA